MLVVHMNKLLSDGGLTYVRVIVDLLGVAYQLIYTLS